jgi:hypothetical protein
MYGDAVTGPPAHTSERPDDSDNNPFDSDDEVAEATKRSSRVQNHSSRPGDPSAEDHPMGDGEESEQNPRASSETLGREPVRSATLPHKVTGVQRGPQTPRVTVQSDVEAVSGPQTGEQSRRKTKVSKRLIRSGSASDRYIG